MKIHDAILKSYTEHLLKKRPPLNDIQLMIHPKTFRKMLCKLFDAEIDHNIFKTKYFGMKVIRSKDIKKGAFIIK